MLLSVLLMSTQALSLTELQLKRCSSIDQEEVIRIATAGFIENGRRNREEGLPDSENPWPFSSYSELRTKYPDCCNISRTYKGDYDPVMKKHLEGGNDFPVFIVHIAMPSLIKEGEKTRKYNYIGDFIVTCYGEIVTENELLNMRR